MLDKLRALHEKFKLVEEQMSDPNVIADQDRYRQLGMEYSELKEISAAYLNYKSTIEGISESEEIIANETDPDFIAMAKDELEQLKSTKEKLDEQVKFLLIPKDKEDSKNAILEIRSGTGGDEASLFAGDLYKMYSRYVDSQSWSIEVLSITQGTVGGYSKLELQINGSAVYGKLKYESGAHRVQRIPKTESQGRVHTSAATVAVLPIMEMQDVNINKADLKVDTYRSSGAGGQHVNKTESAVRLTHLPTGVVSESQDGRSQIKNREIAMQRLIQKIKEKREAEHHNKVSSARKSLVGSGDRSDKIRTYNYPQNRVTDHRLEAGNKNFNLQSVVDGDIGPIIEALQVLENAEKLKEASA